MWEVGDKPCGPRKAAQNVCGTEAPPARPARSLPRPPASADLLSGPHIDELDPLGKHMKVEERSRADFHLLPRCDHLLDCLVDHAVSSGLKHPLRDKFMNLSG